MPKQDAPRPTVPSIVMSQFSPRIKVSWNELLNYLSLLLSHTFCLDFDNSVLTIPALVQNTHCQILTGLTQVSSNMLHLETINLARIVVGDSHERQKLKEAATRPGGFLLDFRNTEEAILDAVSRLYDVSDRYFQRPSELKLKDVRVDIPSSSDRG